MENKFDLLKEIEFIFEGIQARNERTIKRLIVLVIITIALLFASNAIWLYCWMQYDYTATTEQSSVDLSTDGGGDANYIGNNGDINNGTNSNKTENSNENP